ncbi:MAG: cold shock and DUF1294 domain-containing protein [Chloroflexota bacterium]|nr:cold shock and DUF1294 domain-containing protein [Chloroflexota bacterium]
MHQGVVKVWKDDAGYGFIVPDGGGEDVFLHISELGNRQRRPHVGDRIRYRLDWDERGRPRAANARIGGVAPSLIAIVTFGAFTFSGGWLILGLTGAVRVPWPLVVYTIMSAAAFAAYGTDKSRAMRDAWRVSEQTLHILEALGGWPGALLAQHFFRHKRQKTTYQVVFWCIGAFHIIFWVWWLFVRRPPMLSLLKDCSAPLGLLGW